MGWFDRLLGGRKRGKNAEPTVQRRAEARKEQREVGPERPAADEVAESARAERDELPLREGRRPLS